MEKYFSTGIEIYLEYTSRKSSNLLFKCITNKKNIKSRSNLLKFSNLGWSQIFADEINSSLTIFRSKKCPWKLDFLPRKSGTISFSKELVGEEVAFKEPSDARAPEETKGLASPPPWNQFLSRRKIYSRGTHRFATSAVLDESE